jgi:Lon protease-like protein
LTRRLPIFPLGTVLMPTQLLPLHVFEARYRELMQDLVAPGVVAEMGVVLIERGHEVGGGDQRVDTGTVARLVEAQPLPDGRWVALFAGTGRFRVVRWLPDDPYPQAEVEEIPEPTWDPEHAVLLGAAEDQVRAAATLAAQLGEAEDPAEWQLTDDPVLRAWQLCAVAPLGPLDRQRLLEASQSVRLTSLIEQAAETGRMLAFRLGGR